MGLIHSERVQNGGRIGGTMCLASNQVYNQSILSTASREMSQFAVDCCYSRVSIL